MIYFLPHFTKLPKNNPNGLWIPYFKDFSNTNIKSSIFLECESKTGGSFWQLSRIEKLVAVNHADEPCIQTNKQKQQTILLPSHPPRWWICMPTMAAAASLVFLYGDQIFHTILWMWSENIFEPTFTQLPFRVWKLTQKYLIFSMN